MARRPPASSSTQGDHVRHYIDLIHQDPQSSLGVLIQASSGFVGAAKKWTEAGTMAGGELAFRF